MYTNLPYYLKYISFEGGGYSRMNISCCGYSKNYKVLRDEYYIDRPTPAPNFLNNYNYSVLSLIVMDFTCFSLILYISQHCTTVDISYYPKEDNNLASYYPHAHSIVINTRLITLNERFIALSEMPLSLILLTDYLPAIVIALVGVLILTDNHIRAPLLLRISDNLPAQLQILYNSHPYLLKLKYDDDKYARFNTNICLSITNRRNLPLMYEKYVS
jgi:hypothetical protein